MFMDMIKNAIANGALNAGTATGEFRTGFESIGEMTIKKQQGISFSIGTISNWVTKWTLATHQVIVEALEKSNYKSGHVKTYVGIKTQDSRTLERFLNEPTQAEVARLTYALDKACHEEIQMCEWTVDNIRKFQKDMIMIGRLYQEKTIDYAKKLNKVEIIVSPMKEVTALSLKPMSVKLGEEAVEIQYPTEYNPDKIVIDDAINKMRVKFADEFKQTVDQVVIPKIQAATLPHDMDAELRLLRTKGEIPAFTEIKSYYGDIVGGYMRMIEAFEEDNFYGMDEEVESIDVAKEAFKSDRSRLENMIRMATRHMTPEERGAYMKYSAGRTYQNEQRTDGKENRFYLSLCQEEFLLWLFSMNLNDLDFAGHKLLGNKGYEEGDMVWFEEGQAELAILDGRYTGWMEIKSHNGTLYGAVDIKDLIQVPEVSNQVVIKVKQGFVARYGADKVVAAINRAQHVRFTEDFKLEIDCIDKTRLVDHALGGYYSKMFAGLTGSITKVSKNQVKNKNGQLIDSVYISVDLDELPAMFVPADTEAEVLDIEESDEL